MKKVYNLYEILSMPNNKELNFKIVEEVEERIYQRVFYIDEVGVLRYEASEEEIEMNGENIPAITKEFLKYHWEVVEQEKNERNVLRKLEAELLKELKILEQEISILRNQTDIEEEVVQYTIGMKVEKEKLLKKIQESL